MWTRWHEGVASPPIGSRDPPATTHRRYFEPVPIQLDDGSSFFFSAETKAPEIRSPSTASTRRPHPWSSPVRWSLLVGVTTPQGACTHRNGRNVEAPRSSVRAVREPSNAGLRGDAPEAEVGLWSTAASGRPHPAPGGAAQSIRTIVMACALRPGPWRQLGGGCGRWPGEHHSSSARPELANRTFMSSASSSTWSGGAPARVHDDVRVFE